LKIVFLIILFVGVFACKKTTSETGGTGMTNPVTPLPVTNSTYTYLALGDSYTIGQSVPGTDRFPMQTVAWLRSNDISINDPYIIATTGWTTQDLEAGINAVHPNGPFNVVSLLIGVNDQYQRHDTIGYRDRFWTLLNRSIQYAGGRRDHVFVLSIPDYSVTPFATYYDTAMIRKQIGWFNAINKDLTIQNYCTYLDITPSTREAATDPTLIAGDGLHPSGKEYKKWADRLGPMMKTVLP
jgi:lysophospholipase L1-like esterase